ncbi:unnamed protein product [Polarella glacialis]|uniref:Ion transport domain-containing protein n=1 Tax=Polarella glacialis TaxID=89957 RepID=A0A813GG54_POLGL|nr:unnamed protein product [Polarella glacialis]
MLSSIVDGPVERPLMAPHGSEDDSEGSSKDDPVFKAFCEHDPLLRPRVWMFLSNSAEGPLGLRLAARIYHAFMLVSVVSLIVLDSTDAYDTVDSEQNWYWSAELVVTVIWSFEFWLRVWSGVEAKTREEELSASKEWFLPPRLVLHLVDLISLLALIGDLCIDSNDLRGVASCGMLRLFTLFRLDRDWHCFRPVLAVLWNEAHALCATVGIALLVLLVSAVIMFYIESPTNDDFQSVADSLWWASAALTTVGYGDVYPTSDWGRFFGSVLSFLGIGLFALPAGILASGFLNQRLSDSKKGAWTDTLTAHIDARLDEHTGKLVLLTGNLALQIDMLQADMNSMNAASNVQRPREDSLISTTRAGSFLY